MNKICFQSERFTPCNLYSPAVYAGGLAYLSGMGPTNPQTGKIVSQDFTAQVHQTMDNLILLLNEMGLTVCDVVKVNVFLSDISNFQALNAVYTDYFTQELPARTTVQVAGLPGGIQVEIEMVVAVKNDEK